MTNSREITALFRKENAAIEVTSAETLALHVEKLLTFPEQRKEMVNAAWKIVQAQSQVVEKVVEGLEEFLENFEKKVSL
jgi:3-deoxy-D-manno-octulosonic-acid transferase